MPILLALGAIACVQCGGGGYDDLSVVDVFLGLLALLVVSAAALWPRSGRDQRVELEMERLGWADRVQLPTSPVAPAPTSAHAGVAKPPRVAKTF
jgi:hypothetical protein